jgi:serine/threonine-protein kinase
VLSGIEAELAHYVGPVAKVLVRRAAAERKDLDSLVQALLGAIEERDDRASFTQAVLGRAVALPAVLSHPEAAPAVAASTPGPPVSADDVERATRVLTTFIGPIARVVTKRAATDGTSRREFFAKVAQSLDTDAARERFLREAGAASS